jgi:hypothetical protein
MLDVLPMFIEGGNKLVEMHRNKAHHFILCVPTNARSPQFNLTKAAR